MPQDVLGQADPFRIEDYSDLSDCATTLLDSFTLVQHLQAPLFFSIPHTGSFLGKRISTTSVLKMEKTPSRFRSGIVRFLPLAQEYCVVSLFLGKRTRK